MPKAKPGARAQDPARSRRVMPKPDVIPDGARRKDRRDWLSVMNEGHPEQRRPRKESTT